MEVLQLLLAVSAFPPFKKTLKWKNFSSISHKSGFPLHVLPRKRNCGDDRAFCMEDAETFSLKTKPGGVLPYNSTLSNLLLCHASNDSVTGNSYLLYYSVYGSLAEMEVVYGRLKRSRILIEEEAIRAMSFAYIKEKKFYALGQSLKDVGLGRRNVGNLLWNLLLLSYAANFKMKSLQREFVKMLDAGLTPDLTTFNIRALAFSRMSLFWDLHVSLKHMKHKEVFPDLVTYGHVVDAYLDKRLGRSLEFALSKLNKHNSVSLLMDPLVFEVMGKGDFHTFSEVTLECTRKKKWTYNMLIATYLKKKFQSNHIFWNY